MIKLNFIHRANLVQAVTRRRCHVRCFYSCCWDIFEWKWLPWISFGNFVFHSEEGRWSPWWPWGKDGYPHALKVLICQFFGILSSSWSFLRRSKLFYNSKFTKKAKFRFILRKIAHTFTFLQVYTYCKMPALWKKQWRPVPCPC